MPIPIISFNDVKDIATESKITQQNWRKSSISDRIYLIENVINYQIQYILNNAEYQEVTRIK